jgi:hypothetical protein
LADGENDSSDGYLPAAGRPTITFHHLPPPSTTFQHLPYTYREKLKTETLKAEIGCSQTEMLPFAILGRRGGWQFGRYLPG